MTGLKNIPPKVRREVEERDNYTCIYCLKEFPKGEYRYQIAHYHSRNTHDNMRKENLVILCNECHQLSHQDLLKSRQIKDRMKRYLSKLYPEENY